MSRKCPYCGEPVPSFSINCPKCYKTIPREEPKAKEQPKSERIPNDRAPSVQVFNSKLVMFLALIPAAVGLMGMGQIYMKEYGKDTIEIHTDAIDEKDVVLLHDDLLATGGSMKAAYNLVKQFNPKKIYINFIIELTIEGLNGRAIFDKDVEMTTLLKI